MKKLLPKVALFGRIDSVTYQETPNKVLTTREERWVERSGRATPSPNSSLSIAIDEAIDANDLIRSSASARTKHG
jgi:hypothetical protein